MKINWYPGHMKKTKELLQDQLGLVDIVIEILDARIPCSSQNPQILKIISNKKSLIILNKSDLADESITVEWLNSFRKQNKTAIAVNSIDKKTASKVMLQLQHLYQEKAEQLKKRGRNPRPVRVMIVGVPNVGKSTLINLLAGKKRAQTGDKPGITKGKQWIKIHSTIELLDTPGILWPKFEDELVGIRLAQTGAIKDEILDIEELGLKLLEDLLLLYPQSIQKRYGNFASKEPIDVMKEIALNRGCVLRGFEIDFLRVSNILLDEFRGGKLGRMTLEKPSE
ncbi:ribosome biogenesis GTPase YlqF [Tindallia californiensis]|uniref:Ribosome biogenesis GTPase A n=1 Tax=Tindallia californiensis TaxID=159292 RepID=A0A1H3NT80_9FIRM|nr:ribosome biogenesis GTPase YlqF [Tindallia californiensis]SDY91963.1 ribosome biogenesis GTPase A [Tindallia californiensis]